MPSQKISRELLLFTLLFGWPAVNIARCQVPDKESPADRIVDTGEGQIIVFNDNQVVIDDIQRMINDIGLGDLRQFARQLFEIGDNRGISREAGMIWYLDLNRDFVGQESVFAFRIEDREKLVKEFAPPGQKEIPDGKVFAMDVGKVESNPIPQIAIMQNINLTRGMTSGRSFLVFDGDNNVTQSFLASPPLSVRLDERGREIINNSGITAIGLVSEKDAGTLRQITPFIEQSADQLTAAEQKWLREFADVAMKAQTAIIGLKYHERLFRIRTHVMFDEAKSFAGLIDFAQTNRDWNGDLGFESDQLAIAAAIQMDAFRSSAAARVIPQLALRETGGRGGLEFLQGNMLGVLAELSGDSWNDLTAARIGLYINDASEMAGQLAIIGIVDARNPGQVVNELKRLSRLTSPESRSIEAAEREEELLRLVEELGSSDDNIADRAESRLALAGKSARSALQRGIELGNQEVRERAGRILEEIDHQADSAGLQVVDPEFWTTLNPGLKIEEATGKVAEFISHTIHVTPDPSKSKEEVNEAIRIMVALFGESWNSIQVVQIRDHFVFMLGSDQAMLERIVNNVDKGHSVLTQPFADAELVPRKGQMQVWLNSLRLINLFGFNDWTIPGKQSEESSEVTCIGLDFSLHSASLDALVPVEQLLPFLRISFGL